MIKAQHTRTGKLITGFYSGKRMEAAFRAIHLIGEQQDNGKPVLMIANHFCWWDGFIQYRLNKHYLHRKFHVMMLEDQLKKYPFLNGCGAYSVRRQSRDIINTLEYSAELLNDPGNMVLLFPQGKIESIHTPYIQFEKGLAFLLRLLDMNEFQFLFNVNLVDYGSYKKPALNIYFKHYQYRDARGMQQVETDFNHFYQACKTAQCKSLTFNR
ncbi:MAG: lysophospholipid acyltransferase family protein [Tannerellaceae bacterium]|nr:lysophospholipid acyltransferase family protein [Tannerellaceae bacterium]